MTRRLLLSYLTITAFVLVVLVTPLGITFAARERDRLEVAIERDATAIAALAEEALENGQPLDPVRPAIERYAADGGRVVIVDPRGFSVEDTDAPGEPSRDFSTRPEIQAALAGERSGGVRASTTLGHDLLYVAIPVASGGVIHGAVRISYPTSTVDARVRSNWLRLGGLTVAVLASVAGAGLVLARGVTGPVRRLEAASGELAAGDFDVRVSEDDGPPELRALARSFNVMADRVDHLVGAHRRFVADASHQLRTPLTALQLQLETLDGAPPAQRRKKVAAALAETERLGQLVESLLVLARADAGPVAEVTVDLGATVRDRAAVWDPVAREHGVELKIEVPPEAPVRAMSGAIEQVLDNLLSNAIAVSPAGSTIRLTVIAEDTAVELHVADQGPGMTAAQRERAFERFWRGPDSTGRGFGLGLAIVHQLVTASGGEVRLQPGAGGRGLDAVVVLRRPTARHAA
ncbi:MAG TPA: ATP-binding protein [Acidimicrobiales bacterium]|nr:ATP-binding protein [Acidimicrobiales bacterium]